MFNSIVKWFIERFMKDHLIESLRVELETTLGMNDQLHELIAILSLEVAQLREEAQPWYQAQDEDMARQEADERADEVHVNVELDQLNKDLEDIPF